jgi:hypothetical protein
MKLDEALELLETFKDPLAVKSLEKTLVQMERFLGMVSRDQNRGVYEDATFFDGYDSAMTVWLRLLSKEFPGLRNKIK